MEKLIINPIDIDTGDYRFNEPTIRLSGTYLHGQLQDDNGYDIFGIITEEKNLQLEDGMYPCEVRGLHDDCTFFYWKRKSPDFHRGLVVRNDDVNRLQDARAKFDRREPTL